MQIIYEPSFMRQFKKIPNDLQIEVYEKIEIFQKDFKNSLLKTHKLKGQMKNQWSFSINYSIRIVFEIRKESAHFLEIGGHDIYK